MESNKLEAIREIEIAETLMTTQNYNEAKEKLIVARRLYPQLQHISPMVTVCNILSAATSSQGCLSCDDWYWVLQTDAGADQAHVASRYQSVVKSLQTIRNNKFPGTQRALDVLENAFYVLSVSKVDRYYDFSSNRKMEVFEVDQVWAAYDDEKMPRRYGRIIWVIRSESLPFEVGVIGLKPIPRCNNEKRWCEAGLPVVCGEFGLNGNNMIVRESTVFSHVVSCVRSQKIGTFEILPKKGEVWVVYKDWKPFDWCRLPQSRKGCGHLMVEILTGYSKCAGVTVALLEKVVGLKSTFRRCTNTSEGPATFTILANDLFRFSHNVPASKFRGGEIGDISAGWFELDPVAVPADLVEGMTRSMVKNNSRDGSSVDDQIPMASFVDLDPEITDVKSKWSKKDFTRDQVWAVYDGPDYMPRRYGVVKNVASETEVCTTFLEPDPKLEDERYWLREKLPFACGLFKAGRTTIVKMSQFSHIVTCEFNRNKLLYKIYPKKGDIWALYKNWHPKWKSSDFQCHQYLIVEVLSDFSEGSEMKVVNLVKAKDTVTFVRRQLCNGVELIRMIPRMDMLSLSHQIPCFAVPRIERNDFLKGALHLEPDAVPCSRAS
ncbi:hypothetical protein ACHQM5_010363 [Ranunculus cassubicifolius]